jgi:hypothetical protein
LLKMQRNHDSRHRTTAFHASTVHDESDEEEASQAEGRPLPSHTPYAPNECKLYASQTQLLPLWP